MDVYFKQKRVVELPASEFMKKCPLFQICFVHKGIVQHCLHIDQFACTSEIKAHSLFRLINHKVYRYIHNN